MTSRLAAVGDRADGRSCAILTGCASVTDAILPGGVTTVGRIVVNEW
jgi:hypothetical protein